jgi:hypothetical protein
MQTGHEKSGLQIHCGSLFLMYLAGLWKIMPRQVAAYIPMLARLIVSVMKISVAMFLNLYCKYSHLD